MRIVGASTRAAAFSALRGGLHPSCADLFADVDLQQRCSVLRLTEHYPRGFQRFLDSDLPGPWMYTGGLENWPRLVQRWAQCHLLWGNAEPTLSHCRNPQYVASLLRSAAIAVPAVADLVEKSSRTQRWLLKPRRGAGGSGIRFGTPGERVRRSRDTYCQEFIEGQPLSLIFLGDGRTARLLGMTRQLIGAPWLRAASFHYGGNIGPLDPSMVQRPPLEELGRLLASGCFLRGLFGVDGVVREGVFWPVEINPRYTASVEVLEYAMGVPMLSGHAHVFLRNCLPPLLPPLDPAKRIIGKAILFARADLHFPVEGPWMAELRSSKPVEELPAFADIPAAGERIEAGKPILTFFAVADSPNICEDALRQIAADLDRWLFQR